LGETHHHFGVEVLSCCLVSMLLNNRSRKTDGSLFHGRHRTVCVGEDEDGWAYKGVNMLAVKHHVESVYWFFS